MNRFFNAVPALVAVTFIWALVIQSDASRSRAALRMVAYSLSDNFGRSEGVNRPVSQQYEDACLGYQRPRMTYNPLPNNLYQNQVFKRDIRNISKLNNRDFVFVLDSSGSIPNAQFEMAKSAISTLVKYLCPTEFGNNVTAAGTKQISVVAFSRHVTTEIDFSESSRGLEYLQEKILSIRHQRSTTATGNALAHVRNNILGEGSSRLNDTQVATDVIVITDGRCNVNCGILGTEANAIREMGHGVNLFALAVGNARACELEIITGQGTKLDHDLHDFTTFERFADEFKKLAQSRPGNCA